MHDNFGFYKTIKEKEEIKINALKEKRAKTLERRKNIIKFCHDKLGLFQTAKEIGEKRERKLKLKLKLDKEKEKIRIIRRNGFRKFLHDNLGFYKTLEEIERVKAREKLEKIKKEHEKQRDLQLKEERKKTLRNFLHNNLGFYKTQAEKRKDLELKLKKIEQEGKALRRFLHHLGFFKTIEEKEKIEKIRYGKKLRRQESTRKFLHYIGFYKTKIEIEKEKAEKLKEENKKKIYRLELKNKIIEKTGFIRRLFRRKIALSEEMHVLIALEEEAIRRGHIKKAKELQNKINKIYKRIEFKRTHPKLAREYSLVRGKIESLKNKLISLKGSQKFSLFSRIKSLFSEEVEKNKIDEIEFLIKKCEYALKANKNSLEHEIYLRLIYVYKKLNSKSKKIVKPEI